ncbi:hypothetical protein D3H65_04965 [Paraflavitalea soli]|uniref:Uncharacterized protein n=1 Tax=Paraflavitalea soli TaxID=2315862 RepID=A0A3B7MGP9_9BACT|nr:hypothetical protein [Paraflavitalea soli]AXY73368.1 hypothetical protein D3H65_04965 [Paraflavitalea soli]
MSKKRKATLLLPEACSQAAATATLLPAEAAPMHSPAQILELVQRFMLEKGLPPQRESFIKLNGVPTKSKISPRRSVPWLSLRGAWLQNAGLAPNGYAKTIAFNGMLIVIPGLHPPVVNDNDLRHLSTIIQKLSNHVHAQK